MADLTPRQIVAELDRYIVGQDAAKRAVAVAIRNRWRRQQLPPELRKDVTPKNIIMIGPTGVGKTEIARRLAQLVGAPFLKIEATKYTEVGYHGRDVESMIRDLTEIAVGMVRQEQRKQRRDAGQGARHRTAARPAAAQVEHLGRRRTTRRTTAASARREKMKARLEAGELEDRMVELNVEQKAVPVQIFSNLGMEQMDVDFQSMFERIMPKQAQQRQMPLQRGPAHPARTGDRGAHRPPGRHRKGGRAGREPGHDLHRRAGQGLRPAVRARPRRVAPGRAARPAAGRRGHDGQHALRPGAHRPHPVHRGRGVPPVASRRT